MNRRGQIFSGILVLITLLMCGISIGVYWIQQERVQSSLVSPLAVLELRDNNAVFEMREKALILESLNKVGSDFGSDEFLEDFRKEFLSGVDEDMKDFIFWSWSNKDGERIRDRSSMDSFLKNVVYGKDGFSWDSSSVMRIKRGEIEKSFEMRALNVSKTNFAVDARVVFSKEYLIKKRGGKFFMEDVE